MKQVYVLQKHLHAVSQRKMISNERKSVKVIITLGFLHKLIKLPNLTKAGHKYELVLAILEYCVYQSKNSQYKHTH